MTKQTLFFKSKRSRLSNIISISSPEAFRASIEALKGPDNKVTLTSKRALVLAQNRARAILHKKNLSANERRQFNEIVRIKLPEVRRR